MADWDTVICKRCGGDHYADTPACREGVIDSLRDEIEQLRKALAFYADPDTYFAIMVLPDPPCGEFINDFDEDHGNPSYDRAMPGKRARQALQTKDAQEQNDG